MTAEEREPQNSGRWKADGMMVTDLGGQEEQKPNCLQGGVQVQLQKAGNERDWGAEAPQVHRRDSELQKRMGY